MILIGKTTHPNERPEINEWFKEIKENDSIAVKEVVNNWLTLSRIDFNDYMEDLVHRYEINY